tara:strand:- start:124 stop:687 length:564 start_codon:yes stop_codon:yes gene_type:complete
MIIKLNKDLEYKLDVISKKSKVTKPQMLEKMVCAFIERYEAQKGMIEPRVKKRDGTIFYPMYELYKEMYLHYKDKEYKVDKKKESWDYRHLKSIRGKIMDFITSETRENIVSIEDEDLLLAFQFVLQKMPKWWVDNNFNLGAITKHFDTILTQIKEGNHYGGTKQKLDDFIDALGNQLADQPNYEAV